MSFNASSQGLASGSYQSLSEAPLNGVSETYEAKFDGAKTIFEGFVKDANFTTPIADDGRLIGDHWVKGHELKRSTSSFSSTPFPTLPLCMASKVRPKGPRFLMGICNMDTISKDNTEGDGARMDNLLANVGRKLMGIKRQEPAYVHYVNAVAAPGCRQENRRFYCISPGSERRPGLQATNNGDSCIHHSDNEDDVLSNTSLLPVKQGFKDEGGYNGFVISNMDQDVSINPSLFPGLYHMRMAMV
ncbi:uncharacterized protein FFB14_04835 [Fusarium fujikuroi]|nr:uncharacterized protein FFB14_04835 [Fusarium fujikuroi]